MRWGLKLTHRRTPRARAAGRVERGVEDARRDRRVAAISFRSFARARGSSAAIERRTRVATVRLEIVMGRDDDFPGRVRDARARARDPTASSDALEALEVEAAIATIATAGGRGCGKTALTRRCFAEFRRRDDGNAGVAPREWRATPQPSEEPPRTMHRPRATRQAASHGRRGVWPKIRGALGFAAVPSRAGGRLAHANPLYSVDPLGGGGEDDALLSDAFFGAAGRQTSRTPFLGPEADVESEI